MQHHRLGEQDLELLLLALALLHAADSVIAARGSATARRALVVAGFVLAQAGLGIATLLLAVPLWAALAHQVMAMFVLTVATIHARLSRGVTSEAAATMAPERPYPGLAARSA